MSEITWEQVQAVYPDIPLDELKQQLADYGYEKGYELAHLNFEVVTEGSWAGWSNESQKFVIYDEPEFFPFTKGGIMLIMDSGREPFGMMRKASKWWVRTETFRTYDHALIRSEQVKALPARGNGKPEDYLFLIKEDK